MMMDDEYMLRGSASRLECMRADSSV